MHISHYGRICPIETPEGTNIGLISSLAIFTTIDAYGFLLSPYRVVKNGKLTGDVAYLRADEEMRAVFAPPSVVDPQTHKIREPLVLARKAGELAQTTREEVEYIDISPRQIAGVSAALIPFLEHDDANRALMGSNMQRQAVPLLKTETPLVGTGMEDVVGRNSSMVVKAEHAGVVTQVDAMHIVVNHTEEYKLDKFMGLNERTCLNQKPIVKLGQKVSAGQVIADGGGTSNGVLALGKNVLAAFVSFDGFNFEDAIIVSERLVKNDSFTSIHIDEFTAEVRETRLGKEEFTRDIPNVSEKALRNLDERGVVREGTRVCPGDILVGKVVPKSKVELTPEEKLLHAIFGRAGEDVKNDSLELPSGYEGVVVKTEVFTRRGAGAEDQKKVLAEETKQYEAEAKAKECSVFRQMLTAIQEKLEVSIVDPNTKQKVGASDDEEVIYEQIENFDIKWVKPASLRDDVQKIVTKFWAKITEAEEEKKRLIERAKHGDELPSGVLQMAKIYVAIKRTLSIGDKMAGRHGNKGVIAKIMPEEDMPFLEDGTPLDILLNPLGVPSRMNVGQILETHLGWVARVLGFDAVTPVFDGATEEDIQRLVQEANELMKKRKAELDQRGETPPADGRMHEQHVDRAQPLGRIEDADRLDPEPVHDGDHRFAEELVQARLLLLALDLVAPQFVVLQHRRRRDLPGRRLGRPGPSHAGAEGDVALAGLSLDGLLILGHQGAAAHGGQTRRGRFRQEFASFHTRSPLTRASKEIRSRDRKARAPDVPCGENPHPCNHTPTGRPPQGDPPGRLPSGCMTVVARVQ